jgi:hypothetical protein
MDDESGAVRVLIVLEHILGNLASLVDAHDPTSDGAIPEDIAETMYTARQAIAGLTSVTAWLRGAAGLATWSPDLTDPAPHVELREPASARTRTAARLASMLRDAIDVGEALGESLEDEDPVVHFDAVQAIGLATAVLGASYQRLLRAGLAHPRDGRSWSWTVE